MNTIQGTVAPRPASPSRDDDQRRRGRPTVGYGRLSRVRTEINLTRDDSFFASFVVELHGNGVFVATHRMLPIGTIVALELALPDDGPPIVTRGKVHWAAEYADLCQSHRGLGVIFLGLSFLGLTRRDRRRLQRFVATRTPQSSTR
jgi:Tfp pilus assembly protein PilZ